MEAFDVLIVGGGPAGSTCAWKLHEAGLRPLVIDRRNFPREKPCAGWITPQIVKSLSLDVQHYALENTWQPITGFRCSLMGGKEIELDYHAPISFGIRRVEFDRYLLDRSGAERRLNESVEQISRQDDQWVINNRYTAPMLVGAGGTNCPVSRLFEKQRQTHYSTVVAQEVEFRVPEALSRSIRGEVPALYFCQDLLGYGWCFRKGDYLNIGIGRTDSTDFMSHVHAFQEFMARKGLKCKEAEHRWKGHSYSLYERVARQLFADGVVLLGDSAGLAYAQSGEGIRPAVESGLIAADVIISANGTFLSEHLKTYQSQLEERRGKPKIRSLLNRLPPSWLSSLAAWMLASPWLSRRLLMDELFLHRSEEAIVA
jgi:menaquinone-9 beta-reductase